jgi:hypothetical protein
VDLDLISLIQRAGGRIQELERDCHETSGPPRPRGDDLIAAFDGVAGSGSEVDRDPLSSFDPAAFFPVDVETARPIDLAAGEERDLRPDLELSPERGAGDHRAHSRQGENAVDGLAIGPAVNLTRPR